jgi:hypothetical protein
MKLNFRVIGKVGFLLVTIGFFLKMYWGRNGFQLAQTFSRGQPVIGVFLYLLFASAIAGLVIGLILLKKNIPIVVDWIILLTCIGTGLCVFFMLKNPRMFGRIQFQSGAYVLLAGWIVALIGQIISKIKKETVLEVNAKKTIVGRTLNVREHGMLGSIRSIYRVFVLIGFWVFWIGCGIGGGIIGKALSGYRSNYTVIGVILVLIVGFIIDILIFGFIATILNIDDNIETIAYYSSRTASSSSGSSSSMQQEKKCKSCGKTSSGYSKCPYCAGELEG